MGQEKDGEEVSRQVRKVGEEVSRQVRKVAASSYWRGRYDELEKRSLEALAEASAGRRRAWERWEEEKNASLRAHQEGLQEGRREAAEAVATASARARQEGFEAGRQEGFEAGRQEGETAFRRRTVYHGPSYEAGQRQFRRLLQDIEALLQERSATSALYDGPAWGKALGALHEAYANSEARIREEVRKFWGDEAAQAFIEAEKRIEARKIWGEAEEAAQGAARGWNPQEAFQDQADHVRFEEPQEGSHQGGKTDQGGPKEGGQEGGGGQEEATDRPEASGRPSKGQEGP